MTSKMYIPIILGTARKKRKSELVAKYFFNEVQRKHKEIETEIIDTKDYFEGFTDNEKESQMAKKFSRKMDRADGLMIVTPEYNHGYPGELKLMIDMLYEEYARKPVGLCGVSSGVLGGSRAVEQLRQVFIELRMVPIRTALYFPSVKNLFDEKGDIQDSSYDKKISTFMQELLWYAKVLKEGREK